MSGAPGCIVSRAVVVGAVLGFLLVESLLGCAPERSVKGESHASGGGPPVPDAGVMDASLDAGPRDDGGLRDAGGDSHAGDAGIADAATVANGYVLATPSDWFADYLVVPPAFAPGLPVRGRETTREPPGMYEPTSEEFFSYAFLWWLDGNPELDVDSLRSDVASYYQGLCGAATVTLAEMPVNASAAKRAPTAAFSGTLETGQCFGRPTQTARLELTIYDCPNHPSVLTLISSFPVTSRISRELAALRDGFDCY